MTIDQIIEQMEAKATAAKLDHRCPTCGAGLGRWCTTDGSDPRRANATHRADGSIFYHPARANGSTDEREVSSFAPDA